MIIDWDQVPLGRVEDLVIAQTLGVSGLVVRLERIRRGIPAVPGWDQAPWGEMSDREMGDRLGVTVGTVQRARKSLGIPAYKPPPRKKLVAPQKHETPKQRWERAPLGEMHDEAIAEVYQTSVEAVRAARIRRFIPAHDKWVLPGGEIITLEQGIERCPIKQRRFVRRHLHAGWLGAQPVIDDAP